MASQPQPQSSEEAYFAWLRNHYAVVVPGRPGRWVGILRLMFHWTMHEGGVGDFCGHDGRWCYQTFDLAADALAEWAERSFQGEPTHWHRHPDSGRRRIDGNPELEYMDGDYAAECALRNRDRTRGADKDTR